MHHKVPGTANDDDDDDRLTALVEVAVPLRGVRALHGAVLVVDGVHQAAQPQARIHGRGGRKVVGHRDGTPAAPGRERLGVRLGARRHAEAVHRLLWREKREEEEEEGGECMGWCGGPRRRSQEPGPPKATHTHRTSCCTGVWAVHAASVVRWLKAWSAAGQFWLGDWANCGTSRLHCTPGSGPGGGGGFHPRGTGQPAVPTLALTRLPWPEGVCAGAAWEVASCGFVLWIGRSSVMSGRITCFARWTWSDDRPYHWGHGGHGASGAPRRRRGKGTIRGQGARASASSRREGKRRRRRKAGARREGSGGG